MSLGNVLVVDDEPDLRAVYELALVREGYSVDAAGSVAEGKAFLKDNQYDIMITDMRLPDGLGLELVKLVGEGQRSEKCLVVTAYGSAENAVEALKAGAFDYLTKPVNLKQLRKIVADAVQPAINEEKVVVKKEESKDVFEQLNSYSTEKAELAEEAANRLLGTSEVMQEVRSVIKKVASTMAPVLVHGESGTGKELVAKAIHAHSHRALGPFVAVNCGAIPENLMEAEFFGYRKGSFTGANEDRAGLFASAAGGTLFLDELGELPLPMQAKLLRVIQERAVRPLGAHEEESVDVRVVSATHRDLAQDVKDGLFRQDLFYRLNVIEVVVPPLRQRREDIEEIAESILRRICYESALPLVPIFDPKAMEKIKGYSYPGNVRELENILQRAVAMCDGSVIVPEDLLMQQHAAALQTQEHLMESNGAHEYSQSQPEIIKQPPISDEGKIGGEDTLLNHQILADGTIEFKDGLPANLSEYMDSIERIKLIKALELHGFNRTAAAAQLGLSLRQIRYRMERLNIDVPEG